jgi:SAM-dependent methyltransferase
MKTVGPLPIEQHNVEILRNREAWDRKPRLREVYRGFYQLIAAQLDPSLAGPVVELGSGMGNIKAVIPHCQTSDLFPNPWLDRLENCYGLSFADASVSHLILFDVWHHLRYPGTALREFHRVLVPRGRLILFEPAASWLGRLVYHFFHHEPVAVRNPITWEAPEGFSKANVDYFAAQGSATRLFWWDEGHERISGWRVQTVRPITSFDYFATGGFSGPQLGGRLFHGLMRLLNALTAPFPRVFAARLLVVLEKERT